ncbi:hypothetical protein [Aliiroseovarius subalbicans]|uniref:hypothetical protein n=1 Tax=Aliiroseovarius subalbicans TaxID=2925840 RepID=UPI001F599C10|nr:hypothetical protein [Aliiroseovarius subalbicans]MCI2398484.1 hypothetical protein [Aliiroseovarius subalbicans]
MAEVHIHAGAHRTGSSAVQMFLDLNATEIRSQGFDLAYAGRDGAEGGALKLWLPAPRHSAKERNWRAMKAQGNLAKHATGDRPLILSEENIIGRMTPFYAGKFYPHAEGRLSFLRDVLEGRSVGNLLFLLRPYDSLFVSAYRKRAEENKVRDFDEIAPGMAGFQGGWPEIVRLIRDVLTPRRLIVLPYGRPRTEVALAKLFVPELDTSAMRDPAKAVNASLSDAALHALQARWRAGEEAARATVEAARAEFADTKADKPFAAFSVAQAATLRARYDADLDQIRAFSGVEFTEKLPL